MNRIVIVGNGFDLAHGLPTRYEDFMLDLIKNGLQQCYLHGHYTHGSMFQVSANVTPDGISFGAYLDSSASIKQLLESNYIRHNNKQKPRNAIFNIDFTSGFLRGLVKEYAAYNWVDVEQYYFDLLRGVLNNRNVQNKQEEITEYNRQLTDFAANLKEYLTNINETYSYSEIKRSSPDFVSGIEDLLFGDKNSRRSSNDENLILNFNYTSTLLPYLQRLGDNRTNMIDVHGNVMSEQDLIFGYGHVRNPEYLELMEQGGSSFKTNLKEFKYLLNDNIANIRSFINKDAYKVTILGHSCGRSDGTLLSEIFNHDNCVQIQITYHKESSNFERVAHAIDDHAQNQNITRKIKSFTSSNKFPQLRIDNL